MPDQPNEAARPAFLLRAVGTYTVDASIPSFQWKQMPDAQKVAAVADIQAKMLLQLRSRFPGRFYDLLDPVTPGDARWGERGPDHRGRETAPARPSRPVHCGDVRVVRRPADRRAGRTGATRRGRAGGRGAGVAGRAGPVDRRVAETRARTTTRAGECAGRGALRREMPSWRCRCLPTTS